MLVTEKEAKELWCPFARQQDGANRYGTVPMGWCLGSQCMAWQWQDPFNLAGLPDADRRGLCGLAGKSDQ